MKKVAIIGTVGIPAKYGGFETLAENIVNNLVKEYDITVFCSKKSYEVAQSSYNGAKLKYINLKANGIQSIPYDVISIVEALKFSDTLLVLGVSGCVILPFVKLFSKKKIIVNIDGLEWKRDKWNKLARLFLKFSERQAVNYADIIVSDNKAIQDYVQKEYNKESVLIAYGANHIIKEFITEKDVALYPFLKTKYAFAISRTVPENNIHIMLEAFSKTKKTNFIVFGDWTDSEYSKSLFRKYSNIDNIFLLNPMYNEKRLKNIIRTNAAIYIHGHSAGGTNPTLVEAMYLGLPVFAFDVEYNKETTQHKAKYFKNENDLLLLINNINELDLKEIATDMENIAIENYTWEKISQQYAKLF